MIADALNNGRSDCRMVRLHVLSYAHYWTIERQRINTLIFIFCIFIQFNEFNAMDQFGT